MDGSDPLIRKLLTELVDSIEKLVLLMQLSQNGPGSTAALAAKLGLSEPIVAESVAALIAAGLASRQPDMQVHYILGTPHHEAVLALVKLYEEDRIAVLRLITQISIERVRSEAARVFADAFVFRAPKKPKGDPDA
jgi:DNA-binding MarR family transcriptional regulator